MDARFGGYQLLKRLGRGGMAEVYLAESLTGPPKLQVVKRLHAHLAQESRFLRMFLDEARLVARLAHPNVVQIFNLGQQGGVFFLAMEYVEGLDLRRIRKLCHQEGVEIPLEVTCEIIRASAAALHHAHTKKDREGRPLKIVHRDISPDNILVGNSGVVKVADFGIAKVVDRTTETATGVLKGKCLYMSPEQVQNKPLDGRSDVFALGVVLHEVLTGDLLFRRNSDVATLRAVVNDPAPAPSEKVSQIPRELDRIVLKALEKDPAQRFGSAAELEDALTRFVVSKNLPSGPEPVRQFMAQVSVLDQGSPPPRHTEVLPRAPNPTPAPLPKKSVDAPRSTPPAPRRPPAPRAPPPQRLPPPQKPRTRRRVLWMGISALAVLAILVMALTWPRRERARVRISSRPAGAQVFLDGQQTDLQTPCTLEGRAQGKYELELRAQGYREYRTTIGIPATGEVEFPVILLQRER